MERSPSGSRRRRLGLALLVPIAALALESLLPPAVQPTGLALRGTIAGYQATLAPLAAEGGLRCRFRPSCSAYAREALRRRGTLSGLGWTIRRLARCGPWTPVETHDPPPPERGRG